MFNNTKEKPPIQLALFLDFGIVAPDEIRRDVKPLPILVSDAFYFPLTYVMPNQDASSYLYCARDWYMGLGGDKSRWSNSKSDWLSSSQPVMIETKRDRRQPEMLEYVTEKGLYDIVQVMKVTTKNKDRLQPIKDYLSKAGVRFDEIRRDVNKAKDFIKATEIHHGLREDSKVERKTFTQIARDTHINKKPQYGALTNMVYHKIGRTAFLQTAKKEIVAALELTDKQAKHMRDHINDLMLSAVVMAEKGAGRAFENSGKSLTDEEQMAIVKQCARSVAVSAYQLAEIAGVDLVTDRPLLRRG